MLRIATMLLSLALVTGLFAYDLVGEYSLAVGRPLVLVSLALAAALFIVDAFVAPHDPVESR